MTVFNDDSFKDTPLVFQNGVAMTDAITLLKAADEVRNVISSDMALPSAAQVKVAPVWDRLCKVIVDGLDITATIDTKKMKWGGDPHHPGRVPQKAVLTDYNGDKKYAVRFQDKPVAVIKGQPVVKLDCALDAGAFGTPWVAIKDKVVDNTANTHVLMWLTEVTPGQLEGLTHFQLFRLAHDITNAKPEKSDCYDSVTIPAQQFKYKRRMSEILAINPELADVKQAEWTALDETGVRVKVETSLRGGALWPETKRIVFGEKNPVMFWFTDYDEDDCKADPFAVTVSKTEAWPLPDAKIGFSDEFFDQA